MSTLLLCTLNREKVQALETKNKFVNGNINTYKKEW